MSGDGRKVVSTSRFIGSLFWVSKGREVGGGSRGGEGKVGSLLRDLG